MDVDARISVGELLDKISILDIKLDRMKDVSKIISIQKEKRLLLEIANNLIGAEEWILKLKNVNSRLWDIENQIRDKERKKEFDNEFINLARMVYLTNDQRFMLKNKINNYYKSNIIEHKEYTIYN